MEIVSSFIKRLLKKRTKNKTYNYEYRLTFEDLISLKTENNLKPAYFCTAKKCRCWEFSVDADFSRKYLNLAIKNKFDITDNILAICQVQFSVLNEKGRKVNIVKSGKRSFFRDKIFKAERLIKLDLNYFQKKNLLVEGGVVIGIDIEEFGPQFGKEATLSKDKEHERAAMNATFYGMKALLTMGLLTDMELTVKSEKFPCHQFVLCSASPYLRQELYRIKNKKQKLDSLNFHQISPESISHFLYFLYIGDPPMIWYWNMIEIFFIGCFLEIDVLIQYSVMFLTKHNEFKDIYVNGHRDPEELEKLMLLAEKLNIRFLVTEIEDTMRILGMQGTKKQREAEISPPMPNRMQVQMSTKKPAEIFPTHKTEPISSLMSDQTETHKKAPTIKMDLRIGEKRTSILGAPESKASYHTATKANMMPVQAFKYKPSTLGLEEDIASGESKYSKFIVRQLHVTHRTDPNIGEAQKSTASKLMGKKEADKSLVDNSWFEVSPARRPKGPSQKMSK
ncbi:hypothetical protein B4U79_17383 [Dinothrombium tinctorium]|uniref:BTB domain-containing protein n=1 Tax=Dinothrombium tinctorium TaxID=1965070 RepID=A0A3S4R8Y1_9ACAR|nr:hypothetical protein B4U79_17383 [Dinothrombium tinctorium]